MKIVIASHNKGKITEFKSLLKPFGFEIQTLSDYPDLLEVEETGSTFEENARLKAETIAQTLNVYALADDSGLIVPALNDEPGIYSARYSGPEKDDTANNNKLLNKLKEMTDDQRVAYFISCVVIAHPQKSSLVSIGKVEGKILRKSQGDSGFGYDPLFYLESENKTFAEMPLELKNRLSHRAKAIQILETQLPDWLEE